jgi:hypothetical protein
MNSKPPTCPKCGMSDKVIKILYGMPAPDVFEEEKKGNVRIGGCVVYGDNKEWYCKRDDVEF